MPNAHNGVALGTSRPIVCLIVSTLQAAPLKGFLAIVTWNILCDFDGTIALDDVTDSLLERFAKPGWEILERDWRGGRIGSRECMAGQIALLDASREELDAHLAQRRIDPAFPAFVAAVRRLGNPVTVVSDGIDYAIHRILAREQLDYLPIVANRLEQLGERSWQLAFPASSPDCRVASGTCKCAVASGSERVLMIGDGASDFCVAEAADLVFAKDRLLAHCRSLGIAHFAIDGFVDALARLPELQQGPIAIATVIQLTAP
jgi:2-hydroxy-3-keto-5-methylthiopentenyl-1-phosphate phosphatase